MLGINPLDITGQVRTSRSSISQTLGTTITRPQLKTEDSKLSSRETITLTKENSPDKTEGVASNDGKSVGNLKTEHDSKKEDLSKLTIFEKIKLGWKKLPLFEKIAAGLLIAASVALAIMVSAPLAGMLAIGTIVYIAKDVQNAYNTEKLKIEAEYLKNLNNNLRASSEELKTNLKKAEEANKGLKVNLNSLKKDFNEIQNEAGKAKENIDKLKGYLEIQQEQDKNIKTVLIDNILTVYESISKAQQNQISKLESTNENFEQISKSNNEILCKVEEIKSISKGITSKINEFYSKSIESDDNNQGINKKFLSEELEKLSPERLSGIIKKSNELLDNILQKTSEIDRLSSEIQIECGTIIKNSEEIKKIVNNVIESLTKTQEEYEKTLINVAKNLIIETKNSDDKKWFFTKKDIDALKKKIQENNKINENLIEKLNNNNLNELKLSSEEAILILNAYKDKISTDKNKDWDKASKNIENFINGFIENGEIMQKLRDEASNIEDNMVSIGSSIENSVKIIMDINDISGKIKTVSEGIKKLSIGPAGTSLGAFASFGIAIGALSTTVISAPLVATGGIVAGSLLFIKNRFS